MATYLPGFNFPIYSGWTQYTPVIPKLYWDVYSAEQRMKQLCLSFDKVEHYLDYLANAMNEWNIEFTEAMQDEFAKMWEEIHNGYEDALDKWFRENAERIFKDLYSMVFFGLTLDGYFVAYVPDENAWDDVIFDTGQDYTQDNYGRLMLYYPTDSSHDVWQENGVMQYQSQIDALSKTVEANKQDANNKFTQLQDIVGNVSARVDDVESDVETNTGNIATNTANIATNTADIAAHTSSIALVQDQANSNSQNITAIEETLYTPVEPDENEGGN